MTDNKSSQASLEIKNQTINGGSQQFADKIINKIKLSFSKKALLVLALLLVVLMAALVGWHGHFFTQISFGNQSPVINAGRDVNYGSSPEQVAGIVRTLTDKHKIEEQIKDEQIKALTVAVTALSQGKDIDGTKEQINQAMAELTKGNTEKAKALFAQTLDKANQEAKRGAEAARNLGALAFLDNTQEALAAYKRATELDPDNADGWNGLGILLERIGELNEAIAAYQTVLKLGQTHQDQQEIAMAYGDLGIAYSIRGELDKAVEMHNKALVLNQALGIKSAMADNYSNLGIAYYRLEEFNKTVEMYNKALLINQELGRKEGMAINYSNLGIVYKTRGEFDKGIEMYQKSLAITEKLGDKEKIAAAYGNLGIVYKTRGQFDKAIEMFQKILKIHEELELKEGIAADYANLGNVYKQKGNKAEAKRYYQKSIELFKYIGSPMVKTVQSWLEDLE